LCPFCAGLFHNSTVKCQLSKLVKKPSTITTGYSTVSLASCVPTNTTHIWPLTVCICSVIHSTYVNVVYLAEDFSLYLYIVRTCIHRAKTFIMKRNLQIYTRKIQAHTFIRIFLSVCIPLNNSSKLFFFFFPDRNCHSTNCKLWQKDTDVFYLNKCKIINVKK
jgi:hypothetical protein